MANDRMFLYNKLTKKYLCLGKHLGGPWYISPRVKDLEEFFCDEENADSFWLEEHVYELKYEDELGDEDRNFPMKST